MPFTDVLLDRVRVTACTLAGEVLGELDFRGVGIDRRELCHVATLWAFWARGARRQDQEARCLELRGESARTGDGHLVP